MTEFVVGMLVGIAIGGAVGAFAIALLVSGKAEGR